MTEYIKREDALKMCSGEIQNIRYMTDPFGKRFEYVAGARRINADEIAEQIKKIPSADVAPVRHGVWIPTPCPGIENAYLVVCSKCKAEIYVSNDFNPSNFCPNCGADMRESRQCIEKDGAELPKSAE